MSYKEDILMKLQGSVPIIPTQLILHSLGNGYGWDSGIGWLRDPDNPLESHAAVRKDGYRLQLVDYRMRAEANYRANRRPDGTGALSLETDSSIGAEEEWSEDQVASIIEWCVARCIEFDIPPVICESPSAPGIGWHIMWGTPGEWTPSRKACPGPKRIEQTKNVIIPAVARIVNGWTPPKPTIPAGDDTEEFTVAQIDEILKRLDKQDKELDEIRKQQARDRAFMEEVPERSDDEATEANQQLAGLRVQIDAILKRLRIKV